MKPIHSYKIVEIDKCRRSPGEFALLQVDEKSFTKSFEIKLKWLYFKAVLIELL